MWNTQEEWEQKKQGESQTEVCGGDFAAAVVVGAADAARRGCVKEN